MHPPAFARRAALAPLVALALCGCDALEAVFDGPPDAGPAEAAVGDPCDPGRPVFCASADRVARCGDDGEVEWRSPPCALDGDALCAEGNDAAECVHPDRTPCDVDHCSADGERVYCGETGYIIDREPCLGARVCAEGRDTVDCVQPERAPCVEDGCSADGQSVVLCSPTGFVDRRIGCDAGQVCAATAGEAACVAESMTPCERTERVCTAAGDAVVENRCYSPLRLSQGTRTLHACDVEAGGCAVVDGVADCALDDDIECDVEYQEVGEEYVLMVADAPQVCLGDRLVRCNDFGRLATVARCEWGCEANQWSERTWIGACN